LALALTKNGRYTDAWFAFEHALKINPSEYKLIHNYLICILESGDLNRFEIMYKKAKFLPPEEYSRIKRISLDFKSALGQLDVKRKPLRATTFSKSVIPKIAKDKPIMDTKSKIVEANEEEEKD
jgi:hypothetical protein